jgi:UDP-glucose 6-dehydrogenase
MEVGIIGCGVVGGTLKRWLEKNTEHVVRVQDTGKGISEDFTDVDVVFVCIPVATLPMQGQEVTDLHKVLERVSLHMTNVPVFVKSTVLPGTCDGLTAKFGLPVYHMPEFLTERTADEDMAQHPIVTGAPLQDEDGFLQMVKEIFPGKRIMLMRNREAELAKYAHNCFGAMKVNYFNVIREICESSELNYYSVLAAARITGFIEATHTEVPGPDGKYGFGGKCLPKDLAAFADWLTKEGMVGSGSLSSAYRENQYFRGKKTSDEWTSEAS